VSLLPHGYDLSAFRSIHASILHSDGNTLGQFFPEGFVIGIGKLQGNLVLPGLQLEHPLRLRLAIVLVIRIEGNNLTFRHKTATVNNQVVMSTLFFESVFGRREFVPGDLELVRKRARYGITIVHVGERYAVALGVCRGWRWDECRGRSCHCGGCTKKLAAGVRVGAHLHGAADWLGPTGRRECRGGGHEGEQCEDDLHFNVRIGMFDVLKSDETEDTS